MDPPPPPDADFMDEDMELQLALALSLQETTAADITPQAAAAPAPAAAPAAAGPATAAPAAAPALAPTAAPAPAPAPAAALAPPGGLADLAALLSQGLQAAAQAPPAPAPVAPPPPAAWPPVAPVAMPPAPAQAAGAGGGGDVLASLLQQFFSGQAGPPAPAQQPHHQQQQQQQAPPGGDLFSALAAALGGAGMMPPGGMAPPAAAPAAAPRTGGSRAATARAQAATAPTAAPLPGWAARLKAWSSAAPGTPGAAATSVTLAGAEQLAAVCKHVGEALQVKVVTDSAAIGTGTLFLRTGSGGRELTADSLKGLVNSALSQRRVPPRDRLQALHRAHDALPSASGLPGGGEGGLGAALDMFVGVLAREALGLLREDGADLYFDTGAHTSAFVDALAGGPATMCEPFLDSLMDSSSGAAAAAAAGGSAGSGAGGGEVWRRLMRDALRSAFAGPGKALGDATGLERPLVVLDRVTCTPRLQQCLASLLLADVELVARSRPATAARELEKSSVLGPLFGISSFPVGQDALYHWKVTSAARQAFLETRGYPKNHGAGQTCRTVIQALMARVQDGAGNIMLRLSRVKDGGLCREAMLSWVSAVARANLGRLAFGESTDMRNQQDLADFLAGGSDGFLLNVTGGCLRLAQPFVSGWLDLYREGHDPVAACLAAAAAGAPAPAAPRWTDLLDKHLRPEYYVTQKHRLGDLSGVFNATGSRGAGGYTADDDPPTAAPPLLLAGDSPDSGPSFIADVFFLTQLMLHVGPMPTVYRKRALMHRFRERYQREMTGGAAAANGEDGGEGTSPEELAARGGAGGRDPWSNPLATELQLLEDCGEGHLGEPLFADNLTAFAVLELDWMAWLARGGAGPAAAALALVPEYALGDALDWLTAVLYAGRADLVASKPIAVIMRAVVSLLNANDAVRSAMLQNKIVNLLLAMLASQIQNVQAREARGLALAPDRMSTGERALVGAVLGAPVTQRDLVPALLRAHVNAELVVGLDVDKDSYDKYGMRNNIDKILEELIKDAALKRCLTDLAAAGPAAADGAGPSTSSAAAPPAAAAAPGVEPGLFADYASGIVNTVMHYFKDGLDRLADIYAIERSKANAAAWAALPAQERQRKEDFYRGQQRAARGFLHMGVVNLKWLNTLTADPAIASAFLVEPLRGKAAFLVVSSLELLLGDACKKLQVAKPEQYGFDLDVLVGSVLSLGLQLGAHDRFVAAVSAEPDYSEEIMNRALQFTITKHQALNETRLNAFLARAAEIKAARAARRPGALALAAAAAGDGSPAPDTPSALASQPPLKRRKSMEEGSEGDAMDVDGAAAGPGPSSAAAAGSGPALQCEGVVLPGAPGLSGKALEEAYAAELGPLSVAEYDSTVPGGYFKDMARLADQDSGASRKKMRQLAKELNDMQPGGKLALPCLADAAIFLRQDEARTDKMRAVITGPQGTPYEGGLFVFDIFCPAGYPSDPPVMMVYNTGGGKARYNPNLYADGKVCLSLLGTYNSGHTSEKWNPELSSIYQVLVSIQSQILVDDPMTNEPLSETMAGTSEGAAKTAEYNARLQLMVMRHAMVDCLRHPPPGTADLVRRHFGLLRHRLADTVRRWVRAAPTEDLRTKLDEQATVLLRILAEL